MDPEVRPHTFEDWMEETSSESDDLDSDEDEDEEMDEWGTDESESETDEWVFEQTPRAKRRKLCRDSTPGSGSLAESTPIPSDTHDVGEALDEKKVSNKDELSDKDIPQSQAKPKPGPIDMLKQPDEGMHFPCPPTVRSVTSEGAKISLEELGIAFVIPPGAVPEDKEPLELTVQPCLSGPFVPPEGYRFTSPTYIISPSFDFIKDIQLVIYHFASLQSSDDCKHMSFLSARSPHKYPGSEPQYVFNELKGGEFHMGKSFATISLRHFCLVSSGSDAKDTVLNYSARLYRNSRPARPCDYAVFSIILSQPLYFQHLTSQMQEQGLGQMPSIHQPVRFADASSMVKLQLPSDTSGWKITYDRNLEISKDEVDEITKTKEESAPMDYTYPPKICLSVSPDKEATPHVEWKLNVTGVDRDVFFIMVPAAHSSDGADVSQTMDDKLGEDDLLDITDYLMSIETSTPHDIYNLGLVLGLSPARLGKLEQSANFMDGVILAWLRKEGDVEKRGLPSWGTLAAALEHKRLNQTGIAKTIRKDKNLPPSE